MRDGFRRLVPVDAEVADDDAHVDQSRRYRRAFNEYYRLHGCAAAAERCAKAIATLPHLRLVSPLETANAPADPSDPSEWGDAA